MKKDIFRLAATLFSETSDNYSTIQTQTQILKCVFVINDNRYMNYDEIIDNLLKIYKYHVTEDEVITIIKRSKEVFQSIKIDNYDVFKLVDDIYKNEIDSQKRNIDSFIDAYIVQANIENNEKCKGAIYKYLYELTTTNINSYKILLSGKNSISLTDKELSVNIDNLPNEEKEMIHNFVTWENEEKNNALTDIVYCCLEYCLLINGDTPNSLLKNFIRRREIYLDTNMIFRALGINGISRKNVVIAFLKKCKQAKLKLIISFSTRKEFFDTVTHYISQINKYPRGQIFDGAYEFLSDYNIFSFYDSWHQNHDVLSLKYFSIHIKSLYSEFVSNYGIYDSEKIPAEIYNSAEFKDKRNLYSSAIKNKKQELKPFNVLEDDYYTMKDSHDATIISYIELLREKHNDDKDIFFISSDKALRYWDMTRVENKYPVVVNPSQLFLILIKMCGRSENDYNSFVSFINISTKNQHISAEKANIIVSGISSITEDIKTQNALVSAVYNGDYQDISQYSDNELYKYIQKISSNYLENELSEKSDALKKANNNLSQKEEKIAELEMKVTDEQKDKYHQEKIYQTKIEELNNEKELQKERLCKFAEQKIKSIYIWRWYILPTLIAVYTLCILIFVGFQFLFSDASWNLATKILDIISNTTFGRNVNNYTVYINAALFAPILPIYPLLWKNPWNKYNKMIDKETRVERYIKDNGLV